jgi:hypothetical protein
MAVRDIPAPYEETVGLMNRRVRQNDAGAAGDPQRAARIIVEAARRDDPPSHLLLGVNAVEMAQAYSRHQLAEAATWENVSRSADFTEPYPASFPPDKTPA